MKLPRIKIGRPQRLAALLLYFFWRSASGSSTTSNSRSRTIVTQSAAARCGSGHRRWPDTSPPAAISTATAPSPIVSRAFRSPSQRLVLLGADKLPRARQPPLRRGHAPRLHLGGAPPTHQRQLPAPSPFIFFAIWLGGGLWWVARRLFGNEGGFFALGLYCFCPAVVRSRRHAQQRRPRHVGTLRPGLHRHRRRPRHAGPAPQVATAHRAAHPRARPHGGGAPAGGDLGFLVAIVWMIYLAERGRSYVMQILISSAIGALCHPLRVLRVPARALQLRLHRRRRTVLVCIGGGAAFLPQHGQRPDCRGDAGLPPALRLGAALPLLRQHRPARHGDPVCFPLVTTQAISQPWLWALPFLFTFVGGVFADVLETRQRRMFLILSGGILLTQAMLCLCLLPAIALIACSRSPNTGSLLGGNVVSLEIPTNSGIIGRYPQRRFASKDGPFVMMKSSPRSACTACALTVLLLLSGCHRHRKSKSAPNTDAYSDNLHHIVEKKSAAAGEGRHHQNPQPPLARFL